MEVDGPSLIEFKMSLELNTSTTTISQLQTNYKFLLLGGIKFKFSIYLKNKDYKQIIENLKYN